MVNEDIVTALRNAVNNGEPLNNAIQIMINSGYNSSEVYESSKYISQGAISNLHSNNEEYIPISNPIQQPPQFQQAQQQPLNQPIQAPQNQQTPQPNKFPQPPQFQSPQPQQTQQPTQIQQPKKESFQQQSIQQNTLDQQSQQITPIQNNQQTQFTKIKNKSFKKEIILFIILILLMGILVSTIFFKDFLLSLFS